MNERTGSEERIVRELKKLWAEKAHEPILPKIVKPHGKKVVDDKGNSKKVYVKERKILFPRYTIIKSPSAPSEFAEEITRIANIEGVYRVLHYGEDQMDIAVRDNERVAWESLMDEEYCITESVGFKAGDKIVITSGALKDKESMILRVNANKRTADIEVKIMDEKRVVAVNLDLVRKG